MQIKLENTGAIQLYEQFNLGCGLLLQKNDSQQTKRRQRVSSAKQTVGSQTDMLACLDEKNSGKSTLGKELRCEKYLEILDIRVGK